MKDQKGSVLFWQRPVKRGRPFVLLLLVLSFSPSGVAEEEISTKAKDPKIKEAVI